MSITYPSSVTVNNNITNNVTSSTGGTAGGSSGNIQYNSGSAFAGTASLSYDTSSNTLDVPNMTSTGIRAVSNSGGPPSQTFTAGYTGSVGPFATTMWTIAVPGTGSTPITFSATEPLSTTGAVVGQELILYNIDGQTTFTVPYDEITCAFSGSQDIVLAPGNVVKFILMPGNYWAQMTPIAASY